MTEVLEVDDRLAQAVEFLDEAIEIFRHRSIANTSEVIDVLLDTRNKIALVKPSEN